MALLKINGVTVPLPDRGIAVGLEPCLETMQNANGETVGQIAGRDRYKIDSLKWSYLTAREWQNILTVITPFSDVTFNDPQTGSETTIKMIVESKDAETIKIDRNGRPTHYINCMVKFTDTGE